MKIHSLMIIGASFLYCAASSPVFAQTGGPVIGINRICSVRPAAGLLAQSLATKIKAAMDAGAVAAKRSQASVRVGFSLPKTRPSAVRVDFSKDINVAVNLSAATDKISFQGSPSLETLYQTCNPGVIAFTVNISYRDLSKIPSTQVNIRQTIQVNIQGQYL